MAITRRWATGAAVLLCLAGLPACGGGPAAPDPPVAWPAEPGSPDALTSLDGMLFFMGVRSPVGGIHTYRPAESALTHVVPDESFEFYQTATVSPTGDRYAWVGGGQLWISRFGAIPSNVGPADLDGFFTPQWSVDGTRLLVKYEPAPDADRPAFGWIDTASGDITPVPAAPQDYFAFSPDDGAQAVYGDIPTETWRVAPVGSSAAVPVVAPSSRYYTRFHSVSPNARHAITLVRATVEPRGDVARTFIANAIVDLTTGKQLVVPGGGTLRQGFFRADRTAVLRVTQGNADQVLLVSPSGEVLDRIRLPREAADLALLGHAPDPPDEPVEPTPVEPEPPALPGTVYLLGGGDGSGGLHTLRDGTLTHVVPENSVDFFLTVTVSPDGTRYAWLAPSGSGAEIRVATVGDTAAAIGPAAAYPEFALQWSADSGSLLVQLDDATFAQVDVFSGAVAALPSVPDRYLRVSPDGDHAVRGPSPDEPVLVVQVGSDIASEPIVEPEGKDYGVIRSLAPNGRHAIVLLVDDGAPVGDAAGSRDANAIVDLITGAIVPVPGGATLRQGHFLADGSIVLRVDDDGADRVLLVSPSGDILSQVDLPPGAADLALLGHAA
jgi:hypothetical protein